MNLDNSALFQDDFKDQFFLASMCDVVWLDFYAFKFNFEFFSTLSNEKNKMKL